MKKDDLISRKAAIEAIVSLTAFENEDELKKFVEKKACDDYYLGGLCDVIDEIKNTTAVDAAPVVHARLIKYEPDMHGTEPVECNACNYLFARLYPQNYCPNCGAKLDGERRDSE